ncbi:AraC family transcriptional regulator [Actinophytocola gossypii]|uniref:Helix-turn-helix transcriptional regulator n=1 Tax=Actinophytocola gossypii TaxID=2812003 RepID=A0ABT2JCU5_9PSEU|nr:helix-turn-helix transcriptional regulator [Actinophytocola gossypii]MCT2585536.1 helix-turn-helix transcriptional regulator [Actinophytocola gossypii]
MTEIRHTPVAPTLAQTLASGTGIDAHHHDEHQIVYAARGVLAITTDRGSWVAPATRAIWVPAGTVHAHRAHGELELHLVGLPATENPLGLTEPSVLAVGPLLRELILTYTRTPHAHTPQRRRLRAVLLDQLRASPQQPVHLPTPADPRLRALCAILRADPADDRTLTALGTVVGASARTLARLFRSDLGMTFPQWRTQLRLYHALTLLADGTPVTTVAHACGWSSTSAFIDVFRRAFGHTPGTHQRAAQTLRSTEATTPSTTASSPSITS